MAKYRLGRLGAGISALLLAASLTSLSAQERFGSFLGTVSDSSGASVPDVTVTAVNKETNRVQTTNTDSSGSYVFKQMEPGHYRINFERTGFNRSDVPEALLLVGKEIKIDASLQVGGTTQTVEVSDGAPLIDTTGVSISNNITAEEFNNLPKTRSFQSLAQLSPSVNTGQIEGGFQINGASGAENQFFVDGVSTNSLIDGRSRENAAFEFMQEVQVKTGGIDAEYGGATGGVVSGITRSGGNRFYGEAHYYFQGNGISAGPVQRLLLLNQFDNRGTNPLYVQDHKPQNDLHEVGGSVGGYFIKDKLFFFSSVSPQFLRRSNDYLFSNGLEPDTLTQKQTATQMFNKLTWNPLKQVRANFSWLYTPTRTEGILPAYDGYGNSAITSKLSAQPNKTQGWTQPQSNYTGLIDWTVSPTAVLTFRGGRFWDNFRTWGIPSASSVTFRTAPTGIVGLPTDLASAGAGFSNTPRTQQTFFDITTRSYYQIDFSKYVGHFLGSHDIKVGGGTNKSVNKVDNSYPGGGFVYVFFNQQYKAPGAAVAQGGTYGYYEVDNIGTQGTTGGTMSNLYFQDHWRVIPRLSLTIGFRAENEHIPSFRRGIRDDAFSFGFGDKFGPRVGFAWDVLGTGKMKVYGSFARLYGWVPYETSRGSFGGDIYTVYYRSLDTLDVLSLSGTNKPGQNLWPNGPFRDRRIPNFNSVAPGIKPMSTNLINAGIEYQLSSATVFRANFTRNSLVRTIEDMGVLVDGNEVYQFVNPGEGAAKTYLSSSATPNNFATPKPVRNYDALEITLNQRFRRGFSGQLSYVYSRLYGNYAGLGNSDEILTPTSGVSSGTTQQSGGSIARPGSTGTRAWDLDEILFDAKGKFADGLLATDRPHVFKAYGNYAHDWGTRFGSTDLGAFFLLESGTPVSTMIETVNDIQTFANGRGDLGRTPILNQTDLLVGHDFKFGERKVLRFEFNAQNVFNQKTARHIFNQFNRGANTTSGSQAFIDLSNTNLFNGYDYKAMLNQIVVDSTKAGAPIDPYDPRFKMADLFNPGFQGRVGVKFTF